MKYLSTLIILLTFSVFADAAAPFAAGKNSKPNIIYLMADDQNFGSVGIYGNSDVQTPQMDKLGRDGVTFDRHYDTTAICMGSRANVFTGMYEYKTGTNFSHGDMKPEVWAKSYPVLLREAGYLTAFAGKYGLEVEGVGPNGEPGMPGEDFDVWAGGKGQTSYRTDKNVPMVKYAEEYPHSTLAYAAFGKDFISQAIEEKKPFCLSISFKAPHRPTTPDPRFDSVYAGKTFTKPANFGRKNGEHLSAQSKTGRQYPRFTEWKYDTEYDKVMAIYYQQIYAIDVALGMIREELEAKGVADNTVIIYTSDNGYIAGAHGYASKLLPMEEASRVPLMIFDPRSAAAGKQQRSPALTGNIDFAPTILELAGLPIPENMDGVSLLPLLEDPSADVRSQMALMNCFGSGPSSALTVVTKEYKYTYWWHGNAEMAPVEELFHLTKDSLEMNNLAKNPEAQPQLEAMRKNYDAEVTRWKEQVISYNKYEQYGVLFDRTIPVAKKKVKRSKKTKSKVKTKPNKDEA